MFESANVRILAGCLYWSTAALLVAVAYYNRVLPFAGKLTEKESISMLLDYILVGAFYGVIFGGIINIFRRQFWLNAIAAVFLILGLFAARLVAPFDWPFESDPNLNGLVFLFIFPFVGAIIGFVMRSKNVESPFKFPADSADTPESRQPPSGPVQR